MEQIHVSCAHLVSSQTRTTRHVTHAHRVRTIHLKDLATPHTASNVLLEKVATKRALIRLRVVQTALETHSVSAGAPIVRIVLADSASQALRRANVVYQASVPILSLANVLTATQGFIQMMAANV